MQAQIQEGETELFAYWQKLTSVQKDLVLNLIKNIVREEIEESSLAQIPKEIMDGIWKDREEYMNGVGKTYSREEAREYVLRNAAKK